MFDEPPEEEEEEDIDPFAELDVANVAPARKGEEMLDALADEMDDDVSNESPESDSNALDAFLDDDSIEEDDDVVISFENEDAPVPEVKTEEDTLTQAERTYSMLLETVWVDDILDPSEVELLARKRRELGISFARHLEMVRRIIEV